MLRIAVYRTNHFTRRSGVCVASTFSPTRSLSTNAAATGATATTKDESPLRIYKSQLPSVMPLVEKERTLYDYLMKCMKQADPKKVAAIQADDERPYTYEEMIKLTERIAQVLYHVGGIRKGDVVSICSLNHAVYGPMVYGILRLGAIVSPVNVVAPASSLAYHFKTNKCKAVLAMKFFTAEVEAGANMSERETGQKIKVLYPGDFIAHLKDKSMLIPDDYEPLKDATPDDTIYLPFSSGTTGLAKGVQLTNRNLIANTIQVSSAQMWSPDEVTVGVLPMYHVYGNLVSNLCTTANGSTQVVMSKYNVEEYVRLTAKYKATTNALAPPIVISMLNHKELFKKFDLSSLKAIRSGAAPLGASVEAACRKYLPWVSVAQAYGMTEMSPSVTIAPTKGYTQFAAPPTGSSGVLVADTELRIVKVDDSQQSGLDKSAGVDCAPGEEGEIWTRGPQMFKGYLNKEDTEKTMQDGWYRTGDIGHFDEKTGYLTITDRLKELIKYKGFQVSPASMESLLMLHPWVADCVVVGVPDPRDVSFEIPRALVVLKKDLPMKDIIRASDNIYRFVMARNPPHKRLHGGVRIVDAVPRNASNKIMRRQIRSDEVAYTKDEFSLEETTTSVGGSAEAMVSHTEPNGAQVHAVA